MRARQQQEEEDELRDEMVANFQKTGILENTRANLRKQIIDRIQIKDFKKEQEAQILQDENIPIIKDKDFYETQRLYGHLIADYLRTFNLSYTYSIFLPEMHISAGHVLSREEVCRVFGMQKYQYEEVLKNKGDISALEALLELAKQQRGVLKTNREVQTENPENAKSFSMKMDDINHEYLKKMNYHSLITNMNVEEQMHKFQRDCQAKFQKEMEIELQRMKEYEMLQVRASESEKYEYKFMHQRKELDKIYNEKLNKLKIRDKNLLTLYQRKLDDLEKIQFQNRQKNILEIEALNKRELEFKRFSELHHQEIKEEKEKLKKLENELKEKLKEYDQTKTQMTTKVEDDIKKKRKEIEKQKLYDTHKAIETTTTEDPYFSKQQQEQLKILELQRQYLSDDNAHLKRDLLELEFIRNDQIKQIDKLKDKIAKLEETVSESKFKQEQIKQEKKNIESELFKAKELSLKTNQSLQQKEGDQSQLHKQYTMDMERNYFKLLQIEKDCSNKMEQQKQEFSNEQQELRKENEELQQINAKLDEEIIDLRKEMRSIKRRIQEFEEKEKEYDRSQPLISNLTSSRPSQSQINEKIDNLMSGNDHRKKIDDIFKELQEMKEKAQLELKDPEI